MWRLFLPRSIETQSIDTPRSTAPPRSTDNLSTDNRHGRGQMVDRFPDEETMAKITELAESPFALGFGPDTLAEARNRGYRLAE